jgi:hypothetical protein
VTIVLIVLLTFSLEMSSPWKSNSSTSKMSVAPPGILGGLPVAPYPYSDLIPPYASKPHIVNTQLSDKPQSIKKKYRYQFIHKNKNNQTPQHNAGN